MRHDMHLQRVALLLVLLCAMLLQACVAQVVLPRRGQALAVTMSADVATNPD